MTLTTVIELELDPANYPEHQRTPQGMLDAEIQSANADPVLYESLGASVVTVKGEFL